MAIFRKTPRMCSPKSNFKANNQKISNRLMNGLKFFMISLAMAGACIMAHAQELNCEVEINSAKVQNANKEIFTTLQQAIAEYMNTTKWTDAQFGNNEKIQCKLFFTVSTYDEGTGKISGDLQVQSQRPVYNSSYTTTIINFKDTKVDITSHLPTGTYMVRMKTNEGITTRKVIIK